MPDDDWFERLPIPTLIWMYYNWLNDQEKEHEIFKNYSILIGSFTNPEMAKKMVKMDNPDHESTNPEELFQYIKEKNDSERVSTPHRRRLIRRQNG